MKPVPRSVNLALAGLFKHPLKEVLLETKIADAIGQWAAHATVAETFKFWTTMETLLSIIGLAGVILASLIV